MARPEESFTPESVDEQVERYSHVSGGDYAKYNEVLNAHLINQIRRYYHKSTEQNQEHLEDAWQMLVQRHQHARRHNPHGRAGPVSSSRHEQQSKSRKRMAIIVTAITLCLLVAMLVAFALLWWHP